MTPEGPNWRQFSTATTISTIITATTTTPPPPSPRQHNRCHHHHHHCHCHHHHHHQGIEWVVCHELWPNLSFLLISFSTSFCFDGNDSASFAQLLGIFWGVRSPKLWKCTRKVRDKSVGAVSCLVTLCMQEALRCGAEPCTGLLPGTGYMRSVEFGSSRLRLSKIWILTL